jgi:preprotein translocase subunit SecA
MFESMIESIKEDTVKYMYTVRIRKTRLQRKSQASDLTPPTRREEKKKEPVKKAKKSAATILAPAAAGKNYKKCCGK